MVNASYFNYISNQYIENNYYVEQNKVFLPSDSSHTPCCIAAEQSFQ